MKYKNEYIFILFLKYYHFLLYIVKYNYVTKILLFTLTLNKRFKIIIEI